MRRGDRAACRIVGAGLAAIAALALAAAAGAQAPLERREGIVRQWAAARGQGDVAAALDRLDTRAWLMDGEPCSISRPCRGLPARVAVRAQAAGHVVDTITYAVTFGSVVVGRLERRTGALRAAGVDRAVYGFIAQIPQDRIAGWAVLPDLSDAKTVTAVRGPGAPRAPRFADRVVVDRRFADAVTRGQIDAAVDRFTDDGLFITPAGCLPAPCARPQIRDRLRANFANHAAYTFTNALTVGSVVLVRFELRADNFRAKGSERVVNVYIAQVPADRIAAWIQFPDLTDSDTVKFFGPY